MKSDKEIWAEAYKRACAMIEGKRWKKGDRACHPEENVIFEIDHFVTGEAGKYAVAEILNPDSGLPFKTKRFLINEIVDPFLVETYKNLIVLTESRRPKAVVPLAV